MRSTIFAPRADVFEASSGLNRADVISTELRGARFTATVYLSNYVGVPLDSVQASFEQTINIVKLPTSTWSYSGDKYQADPPPVQVETVTKADIDSGEVIASLPLTFTPEYVESSGYVDRYTATVLEVFDASWAGADDFHLFIDSSEFWIPGGGLEWISGQLNYDSSGLLIPGPSRGLQLDGGLDLLPDTGGVFWRYNYEPPPELGVTPPLLTRGRSSRAFAASGEVVGYAPPMLARGRKW
jgi:hypothetical protein